MIASVGTTQTEPEHTPSDMQTFLPYANFCDSARALDNARLGNQCYRETLTLFKGGWPNHPASKMWQGHLHALCDYGMALAEEMDRRNRNETGPWSNHTCAKWVTYWGERAEEFLGANGQQPATMPPWLGTPELHASHRSCLLAKDPEHYGQHGWTERPTPYNPTTNKWPYYWPTTINPK